MGKEWVRQVSDWVRKWARGALDAQTTLIPEYTPRWWGLGLFTLRKDSGEKLCVTTDACSWALATSSKNKKNNKNRAPITQTAGWPID